MYRDVEYSIRGAYGRLEEGSKRKVLIEYIKRLLNKQFCDFAACDDANVKALRASRIGVSR